MHLIQKYSTSCGVKIGKPYIRLEYFPVLYDKYITIHTTSKPAKTYDLWQEVGMILFPLLEKNGIKVIQIGGKDDLKAENGSLDLRGQTDINQTAYIINNAILHLGVDSFPTHIASGLGKKIVSLYSNSRHQNVGPYWTKDEDVIIFEPDFSEVKPSHSYNENPKRINGINPEDIAKAVCNLLNIEFDFGFKTVHVGNLYFTRVVEIVPTTALKFEGADECVIRMDKYFNQEAMAQQLQYKNGFIITDKPIDIRYLVPLKEKVKLIQYIVRKGSSISFINELTENNIPFQLASYESGEKLDELKYIFMDYGQIKTKSIPKLEDYPKLKDKIGTLYYKSQKVVCADNKMYYSFEDYNNKEEIRSGKELKLVKDTKDFMQDIDHYIIFEKI